MFEMILEAIGQPLGTAKWVQESCREMPKYLRQPVGRRQNCSAAIGKNVAISVSFSQKRCIYVNIHKNKRHIKKL
jgi:hypothetical protein